MVFEATAGVQEVLANGFPALPLRLTFRGRLELPVKVENMARVVESSSPRGCMARRAGGEAMASVIRAVLSGE